MIQANELRIGNIVTVDNPQFHPNLKDVPMVIKGIHTTERGYAVKLEHLIPSDDIFTEYSQLIQFIIPIPLTGEILLKAGFEKDIESLFYRNSFIIAKTKTRWAFYHNGLMGGELVRIDDLHQLQNLFFALTGEEIKIDLE